MREQFQYNPDEGITVHGQKYTSFSKACTAYELPRQQTLRAYRKHSFNHQAEVDEFFISQQNHYNSPQYTENNKEKAKFKDRRASPIRYNNAVYKSRTTLAKALHCRSNPFKTRLAFMEEQGVELNDLHISVCAKPYHKTGFSFKINIKKTIKLINAKQSISISENQIKNLLEIETALSLPLKSMATLLGVNYETLKKQAYELKFHQTPTPLDTLAIISTIKPTANVIEFNGKTYKSLFGAMVENNIKLNKATTLKAIAFLTSEIETQKNQP